MTKYWNFQIENAQKDVNLLLDEINQLKEERRQKIRIFTNKNSLLNILFESVWRTKSIGEIFNNNPPAGAGECAAPKLLHYAFEHYLKPIAMAEFWWGQSPKSEIRKHKQFYPACKSKCEPILLSHIKGFKMENPFQENPAEGKTLK